MSEERSFERFVADNVAGQSGSTRLPDDFYDEMHSFATTTRQRPEWLALIKEPPMRTNDHLAVGSPTVRVAVIIVATLLLAVALAAAGVAGQRLLASQSTIVIGAVDGPEIARMSQLADRFTSETGIDVEFSFLSDSELREQIQAGVAQGDGAFDAVLLGSDELRREYAPEGMVVPIDAVLERLDPALVEAYDLDDIIPSVRAGLTVDGRLYALPFHGESSLTTYRIDLFEAAGLSMPEQPTWDEIGEFAARLHAPDDELYGVILSGIARVEQLGPFMAYTYAHGLRWFDEDWQPQFTTPEWKAAGRRWIELIQTYAEPGANMVGLEEGLSLMSEGQGAIWVGPTTAAAPLADPSRSVVADTIGYAMAPDQACGKGHWLRSLGFAIPAAADQPVEAARFILWATGKDSIELVADSDGWARVPQGTRRSTYARPEYAEIAPWAQLALHSIETADEMKPSCLPTPYTGSTEIDIPEWPDIGFDFVYRLTGTVHGNETVDGWLDAAQMRATEILRETGRIE